MQKEWQWRYLAEFG